MGLCIGGNGKFCVFWYVFLKKVINLFMNIDGCVLIVVMVVFIVGVVSVWWVMFKLIIVRG